ESITDHDAFAAADQARDERPLEVRSPREVGKGSGRQSLVERVDGLTGRAASEGGGLEEIGVEPASLQPGRTKPAVERDAVGGYEVVEVDLLEHGIPRLPAGADAAPEQFLRERSLGPDAETPEGRGSSSRLIFLPPRLDQVDVVDVVGIVWR